MSSKSKKAAPSSSSPKSKEREVSVDGVELARLRRLAAAGWRVERCELLGVKLDIGPRSNRWRHPRVLGDYVVSELAVAILHSEVSPRELRLAARRLIDVGGA